MQPTRHETESLCWLLLRCPSQKNADSNFVFGLVICWGTSCTCLETFANEQQLKKLDFSPVTPQARGDARQVRAPSLHPLHGVVGQCCCSRKFLCSTCPLLHTHGTYEFDDLYFCGSSRSGQRESLVGRPGYKSKRSWQPLDLWSDSNQIFVLGGRVVS
eukprot:SAG11_NODE_51_length_19848_cov_37.780698_12_plen_159_part_00